MTAPGPAIARRALGQVWKGALVVGIACGGVAASSGLSYASTYPTVASRAKVAASLQDDKGLSILFGQLDRIGTVGGYTAYKSFLFLTTIGGIWAALATTRLLRGEEDSGRWQLVLAGRTNAAAATRATLAALVGALAIVFAATVALVLAAATKPTLGFGVGDGLAFGASSVVVPAVFVGVGALCSQLARTRRLATALTLVVLAVTYVLRMVGDAGPRSHWLLWATPFGWAEIVHPFTANDAWPLVPAVGTSAALAIAAVALAARRDTGGGVFSTADSTPVRPFGLASTLGLAVRLNRGVLGAWAVGITVMSFVFGIVAKAATDGLTKSGSAGDTLAKLGATGRGPTQYLGVVYLLTGGVLALLPAGQVGAVREEEASGRLAFVLAGPPGRTRWLIERLALAAAAVVATGVLAGLATWAGAVSQGVDADFGSTLLGGVTIVPAALLALALGAAALAVAPRVAPLVVYVVVGWSLVIDFVGSLVSGLGSVTRLSLFHYVPLVPAEDPDWTVFAVLTLAAVVIAGLAVARFARRDLSAD